MHIVDYITQLGAKFAPVDAGVIKTLQIQLTDEFNNTLKNYNKKMEKNKEIKFEIDASEKDIERAINDGNEQEGKDIAYRIQELKKGFESPTLVEKACNFFDKPWVKLLLLLTFGLVSALIAKRILGKKKEDDENDDFDDSQPNAPYSGGQPMYYPPYPPYPYAPYGHGNKQGFN